MKKIRYIAPTEPLIFWNLFSIRFSVVSFLRSVRTKAEIRPIGENPEIYTEKHSEWANLSRLANNHFFVCSCQYGSRKVLRERIWEFLLSIDLHMPAKFLQSAAEWFWNIEWQAMAVSWSLYANSIIGVFVGHLSVTLGYYKISRSYGIRHSIGRYSPSTFTKEGFIRLSRYHHKKQ